MDEVELELLVEEVVLLTVVLEELTLEEVRLGLTAGDDVKLWVVTFEAVTLEITDDSAEVFEDSLAA